MKSFSLLVIMLLSGCQFTPIAPVPANDEPTTSQPDIPLVVEAKAEPEPVLAIDNSAATLQAWIQYRAEVLSQVAAEREQLNQLDATDPVTELKRAILQLHPDTPYLTRLKLQMQSAENLAKLPPSLAALFSWDLAFNQKLLETESAVSALTRLNAQQHDNIERLQKTNKELQKKIDALTQIEAQLNQPPREDNNGQP
jgi:cell division protein FtsB